MQGAAPNVAGVLLAGGRSTRMGGRNKAFAAVGGEAIAARTIRVLRETFPQVIVATNAPEAYTRFDVEVVADVFPGAGPLAGLHAAMRVARHPYVFAVACDMPGLDASVIRHLVGRIGDADAVVPCWDGDIEPLHAVYAVRLLPLVERCLAEGRPAMRDFLPLVRVDWVRESELRALAAAAASFTNVNTPEELAAVGGRFDDA
ncbi:MAG TPA: molybdenum cofactor guanylyltransferase [Candidatus Limnocylindria bacterium]|nr:molybdenum cofactor guanylyltransferase [Candidatus Limnocylindria bacterium]